MDQRGASMRLTGGTVLCQNILSSVNPERQENVMLLTRT